MTEQITESIWRIPVPLAGNPLKELNSYLIKSGDSELLIDTGFRTPECRQALENGLKELRSVPEQRDILLTHLHADHSGLSTEFIAPGRTIWIGSTDLKWLTRRLEANGSEIYFRRILKEGFPAALREEIRQRGTSFTSAIPKMTEQFRGLEHGQLLHVGELTLQALHVPGHTPGNLILWLPAQKIMFTGDHILFDISPNITFWEGVDNSLKNYLDSLNECLEYDVSLALPGHRKSGNYNQRIHQLLKHHEERLKEVEALVASHPDLDAYSLAGLMSWKIHANSWNDFSPSSRWFATGECIAHLDYLRMQGRISRKWENSAWRYNISQPNI